MTLTPSLLTFVLPQELLVPHMHKLTDILDLISVAFTFVNYLQVKVKTLAESLTHLNEP